VLCILLHDTGCFFAATAGWCCYLQDMKRGPGEEQAAQQASRGSSPAGGLSVEEAAAAAREGLKGAGAPTMQPQVQGQGVQGQSDEQRRGGSS
jgi:hypothetical protein